MENVILTNMCLIINPLTNEVVTIKRTKSWPGIAFPGGHIENEESICHSMVREIKEETNLDVLEEDLEYVGVRDWCDRRVNERNVVFMFKTSKFSGTLKSSNEGLVSFRKLEDIKKEEFSKGLYEQLDIFFDKNIKEYHTLYDVCNNRWISKKI